MALPKHLLPACLPPLAQLHLPPGRQSPALMMRRISRTTNPNIPCPAPTSQKFNRKLMRILISIRGSATALNTPANCSPVLNMDTEHQNSAVVTAKARKAFSKVGTEILKNPTQWSTAHCTRPLAWDTALLSVKTYLRHLRRLYHLFSYPARVF